MKLYRIATLPDATRLSHPDLFESGLATGTFSLFQLLSKQGVTDTYCVIDQISTISG